jgi:hypothetical protein
MGGYNLENIDETGVVLSRFFKKKKNLILINIQVDPKILYIIE